jgi:hypothetical protein
MRFSAISLCLRALAVAGLVALAGCAHYHLGPSGALPFATLYVPPARVLATVPQAAAPVSQMLRQSLLQEGNLRLADQADADATLEVVLTNYQRGADATQQNNTLNAVSFTLQLEATCTLVDNRSGKVYFKDRKIEVLEQAFVQSGVSFNESEYQAMPRLARDLSQKIKDAVVDTW